MFHLAQVVHPLYALVKTGESWDWTPISEQAFQGVKRIVKHTQDLHVLQPARPYELDVHVTQEGCGWDH